MAVARQKITDRYALYQGDCCELLPTLPAESMGMVIYSPPFAGLYNYSSSEKDLSNCATHEQFMEHYRFVVKETNRLLMPGRLAAVHCADIPNKGGIRDLCGDVIRLHEQEGFIYHSRHVIWKEPLRVAIRTRSRGLMHKQIVKDSTLCAPAAPDYVLAFRKKGVNREPVNHPVGLSRYVGENKPPAGLERMFDGHVNPKTNKLSHWIWQQYASSVWMDIRIGRVLPFKEAKEPDDEKHVHPLQLDVIERCLVLWTNENDNVLTPFMGVGSEVYTAVECGRRGVGVELKGSYYKQAVRNLYSLDHSKNGVTR